MDADSVWILIIAGVVLLALARVSTLRRRRAQALDRMESARSEAVRAPSDGDPLRTRGVTRWIRLAGYESPSAVALFVSWQAVAIVVGLVAALVLVSQGQLVALQAMAADVPGGFGGVFQPILLGSPWIIALLLASTPLLVVRGRRRRVIAQVEQDLPVVLELLATLGEAGLGFDAALARVLGSLDRRRPLARAFSLHRRDVLSGMSRVDALRRLSARLDVPAVSMLVSALLQSEQIGSALSDTLRAQSADLWNRRREQALAAAQSLPSRLAVPLVVCFLPALFVITLGPILVDFIELAEGILGNRS